MGGLGLFGSGEAHGVKKTGVETQACFWNIRIRKHEICWQNTGVITGWWCNNHLDKYESQWEGWHPVYYVKYKMFQTTSHISTYTNYPL